MAEGKININRGKVLIDNGKVQTCRCCCVVCVACGADTPCTYEVTLSGITFQACGVLSVITSGEIDEEPTVGPNGTFTLTQTTAASPISPLGDVGPCLYRAIIPCGGVGHMNYYSGTTCAGGSTGDVDFNSYVVELYISGGNYYIASWYAGDSLGSGVPYNVLFYAFTSDEDDPDIAIVSCPESIGPIDNWADTDQNYYAGTATAEPV